MTKHNQGFAVPALRLCQNLRADLNSFQLKVGPPDLFANIISHSYHSDLDDTCCERSPHGLTNAGVTYTSISTTCAIPPTSIRPCLPGLRRSLMWLNEIQYSTTWRTHTFARHRTCSENSKSQSVLDCRLHLSQPRERSTAEMVCINRSSHEFACD